MSVTVGSPPGTPESRRRATTVAIVALVGLVGLGVYALASKPSGEAGDLYFTTFKHQSLYRVPVSFTGGHAQLGNQDLVARLPGADGVAFEPSGKALVGGQETGNVYEVDTSNGKFTGVPSGCAVSYLLSVAPSGQAVYTAGLPGKLCALAIDPLRPGHMIPLSGDETDVTDIGFDQGGQAYYTTGLDVGPGNFGLIDLSTGATTRQLSALSAGHGIAFDPYSNTLFLFGGQTIYQIDPRHPQNILSSMTVPGAQLDNGTTDGKGHLYVASNFGQLVVVDLHQSDRLSDPRNVVTVVHLRNDLDDVAPLVGPGAAGSAGRTWITWTALALGLVILGALGYLYLGRLRFSTKAALPTWDIRRKEKEGRGRRRSPRRTPSKKPGGPPRRTW